MVEWLVANHIRKKRNCMNVIYTLYIIYIEYMYMYINIMKIDTHTQTETLCDILQHHQWMEWFQQINISGSVATKV